jgi:hypothetical protein
VNTKEKALGFGEFVARHSRKWIPLGKQNIGSSFTGSGKSLWSEGNRSSVIAEKGMSHAPVGGALANVMYKSAPPINDLLMFFGMTSNPGGTICCKLLLS